MSRTFEWVAIYVAFSAPFYGLFLWGLTKLSKRDGSGPQNL